MVVVFMNSYLLGVNSFAQNRLLILCYVYSRIYSVPLPYLKSIRNVDITLFSYL